jgi:hypothetical protein
MFIVFGSGLLCVTIYFLQLKFIKVAFWMNTLALCLGGVLMLIGIIGYFASLYNYKKILIFYLLCLGIISALILLCCIGYLALSGKISNYVEEVWISVR